MTTTTTRFDACALALTLALVACSPSSARERRAERPTSEQDARALELGELHELVPAAGLRWMIVGQPRRISENADLRAAVHGLLPEPRLRAFAQATSVDLATLPSALAAGFDLGTLYLAKLPQPRGRDVLERFVDYLAGRAVIERPHPRVVRVSGTLDGIPHGFVGLDDRIVGVAVADLTLSRIPIGFAMGKLVKTPPALRGAALSTLLPPDPESELTFYAPGPFDDEWARGARGVLAAALAASVRVEAGPDGFLRATVTLSGEWEPGAREAAVALELAFEELASSSTGKLFGLQHARSVSATFHPQYLTLSAELPLDALVRGLRAAVTADVREILELPGPLRPASPAPP